MAQRLSRVVDSSKNNKRHICGSKYLECIDDEKLDEIMSNPAELREALRFLLNAVKVLSSE